MKPGTYRTTKDLPAIKPDARKRYDWMARPIKAGTLFAVEQDLEYETVFTAWPVVGRGARVSPKRAPELFASLEPVEETPSMWLEREGWGSGSRFSLEILDALVLNKTVTLAELQQLAADILAKGE